MQVTAVSYAGKRLALSREIETTTGEVLQRKLKERLHVAIHENYIKYSSLSPVKPLIRVKYFKEVTALSLQTSKNVSLDGQSILVHSSITLHPRILVSLRILLH